MAQRRMDIDLRPKVSDLLRHADEYHERYYAAGTFSGPSLHFHRRALGLEGNVAAIVRTELIYAVLTSWGMHRMGSRGAKMQPFEVFNRSIVALGGEIGSLSQITPLNMTPESWACLKRVFAGICVMASNTTLVGNSKVMAHLLPELVAPVDREYTLTYLFGNGTVPSTVDAEWQLLRKIHAEFFHPIVKDPGFRQRVERWISQHARYPWDTSLLKVADNLVIAARER